MRKSVVAGLAMWATFAAFAGKARAEVNYPWCIMGDTRGFECVFSSREQCAQDGRNRGFGSQCVQNPAYKPGKPALSQAARPSQAASAPQSTCTRLKSVCLSPYPYGPDPQDPRFSYWRPQHEAWFEQGRSERERDCNFYWDHCMKTGWWMMSGRPAERR